MLKIMFLKIVMFAIFSLFQPVVPEFPSESAVEASGTSSSIWNVFLRSLTRKITQYQI